MIPSNVSDPRSAVYRAVLIAFTMTGIIGLGLCVVWLRRDHLTTIAFIGILLIFTALIGLVITAMSWAIAGVLRATRK